MTSIYSDTHAGVKDNAWALHVVRNPWGWNEEDQRRARLMIADAYEASVGGKAVGLTVVVADSKPMTMERLQTALLAAGALITVDAAKEEPRMVTIRLKFDRLGDLVKGLG